MKHEKPGEQLNLQILDAHFHPENFYFKAGLEIFEISVLSHTVLCDMYFSAFRGNLEIIIK